MTWWPEAEWQRMWSGEDCGMCSDAHLETNPFGDLIVETPSSYVRLCINQTQAGYVVVVAKRHAQEIHHMTSVERNGFFGDVAAAGEAISDALKPVKLANLMMGFRMPHVHCHIYPQYADDDPFALLNPQDGDVRLSPAEWSDRVSTLRSGFLRFADSSP